MDIKDLLNQIAQYRKQNSQEQSSMDQASKENSMATINPSMFTANKNQELKGLPKDDIQNVVSQTKNYMDPRIADMASFSGGIANAARKPVLGVARKLEEYLDKKRDTPFSDTGFGKIVEEKIRQPIKGYINEVTGELPPPPVPKTYIADDLPPISKEQADWDYLSWLKEKQDPDSQAIIKKIDEEMTKTKKIPQD